MLQPRSTNLAGKLRIADSFLAVTSVLIAELESWGLTGIAALAHDATGAPAVWAGNAFVSPTRARRYLAHEHREDGALAAVRASHRPVVVEADASWTWVAPLLGCGDLLGTLRLGGPPQHVSLDELATIAALASVRLAQLGLDAPLSSSVHPSLTPRQHEVVYLVVRGFTNAEIGELLGISGDAVKKHVSRAFDVLGLTKRTELAAIAARWSGDATRCHVPPAVVVDLARERGTREVARCLAT